MKTTNGKILLFCLVIVLGFSGTAVSKYAKGPLRVLQANPRYFTDGSGKAVYLTGSHVWYNLVDMGPTDPPAAFDFPAYIQWMYRLNHNFMRLWTWELVCWNTENNSNNNENRMHYTKPLIWQRSGPGNALDGKPKFHLSEFDPEYFQRLRTRIQAAGKKGIYVSIMLFEGWGLQFAPNAWASHPLNKENNVNGINGDHDGDGKGLDIYTLIDPAVTAVQEAYVKKVIATVNDLDNVLYEISNENHPPSTSWQYHFINFVHETEKQFPKQHPVGMTFQYKGGSNSILFDSPADWISPNPDGGYRDNPPAADGRKVILNDTDHLWGIGGNQAWVWKSFMRGMNPLFMDPYDGVALGKPFDPQWEPVRRSLGYTRTWANRISLTAMTPQNQLASSSYCLANAGREYLIYLPDGREITIDLRNHPGKFSVLWFNPNNGSSHKAKAIPGGSFITLYSPFTEKDSVVYLKKGKRE